MKNNEPEQKLMTDAELDAALAQMAEETPPMPADFHDRWKNAVRAEAKETADEPAEEFVPKRAVSIARWTRILSVAAVFVFLIGGTLLYRSTKKSLGVPLAAEKREAAEAPAAEEAEEAADAGAVYEVQAITAAGAVQNSYMHVASRLPTTSTSISSLARTPHVTSSAPITNSVAAICSPP